MVTLTTTSDYNLVMVDNLIFTPVDITVSIVKSRNNVFAGLYNFHALSVVATSWESQGDQFYNLSSVHLHKCTNRG